MAFGFWLDFGLDLLGFWAGFWFVFGLAWIRVILLGFWFDFGLILFGFGLISA